MLWFYVGIRIFANPLANVFQKILTQRHIPAIFIVFATHVILAVVCAPVFLFEPLPTSRGFWIDIAASVILAVAGNALLIQAVKLSDLSVLGPVNAYKSVVSILPGIVLLHELPTWPALLGVGLIVVGSYFVVDRGAGNAFMRFIRDRGIQYRFLAMALAATEAVFLKRAVLASAPGIAFAVWCALGIVVALPLVLALGKRDARAYCASVSGSLELYFPLAALFGLMQYSTLVIFTGFPVASALALFQLSTLISVFLGWHFFEEKDIRRRLLGSIIMSAGAIFIMYNR